MGPVCPMLVNRCLARVGWFTPSRASLCLAPVGLVLGGLLTAVCSAASSGAAPATASTGAPRWQQSSPGVLGDTATGLQWTQQDNGRDVTWSEAVSHCEARGAGWRLPTLPELKAIYEPAAQLRPCGADLCKISSRFRLSAGWLWSATQVGPDGSDGMELAWGVVMANGVPTPTVREAGYGSRALCVR